MTDPVVLAADDPHVVDRVAGALLDGGVVVLPTDTVYGLVTLPTLRPAIDALFDLKGRTTTTPLAVLCADSAQALALAEAPDSSVRAVAARWWPGPLTRVLPRRAEVELHLGQPEDTVGVRVPAHALVQAVAARVGPVAATSANRHGEPTAPTADAAAAALGPGLALVVDGGPLDSSASAVLDATTWPWAVRREGPLPTSDILRVAEIAHDQPQ